MQNINDDYYIETYVPENYARDVLDGGSKNPCDLAGYCKNEIYRFYGLFKADSKEMIGSIKYSVQDNNTSFSIESFDIDIKYRRKKYGSILLSETLKNILKDFPYLKRVTVCSMPGAISFYEKHHFTPYFGDNNLERNLVK